MLLITYDLSEHLIKRMGVVRPYVVKERAENDDRYWLRSNLFLSWNFYAQLQAEHVIWSCDRTIVYQLRDAQSFSFLSDIDLTPNIFNIQL